MARPAPKTNFYINYGPVTNTSAADSLAPVFIAPRYAVHNIAYGNALTDLTYTGDSVSTTLPSRSENSVVDSINAALVFHNPTVNVPNTTGANITAALVSSGGHAYQISAAQAVAGSNTELLGGYQLRPGDVVYVSGTASGGTTPKVSAVEVTSVGVSGGSATGEATPAVSTAKVATTATVDCTDYTGNSTAIYYLNAYVVSSGAVVSANVTALQGDSGYSAALLFADNTATAIGNFGAKLTFSGMSAANTSAGYIMSCTVGGTSATYTQIYTAAPLDGFNSAVTILPQTDNLIQGNVEVGKQYWSLDDENIYVNANATVPFKTIDPDTNLPVTRNYAVASCDTIYLNYRELLQDEVNTLHSALSESVANWVGAIDQNNPLGLMYNAGIQTGYANFYLMSVAEDTDEAYATALRAAAKNEAVYTLIPLRQTANVINVAKGLITYYSDPSVSQVKRLMLYSQLKQNEVVLESAADSPVLAQCSDGTLTLVQGSFTGSMVKTGTRVALTVYDAAAGYTTINTTVKSVTSPTTCTIAYRSAISTPVPAVFSNMLTPTEYAEALAAEAKAINNHRICYVYSEPVTIDGVTCDDARYLVAELGAMRGAMAPHAPLTDVPIPGASIADSIGFSEEDYEIMNNGGVWVCYRDRRGNMVTRHAITTGKVDTIAEEDSAVANGDNIVRYVRYSVSWLNGQCNVTPALINKLTVSVYDALSAILRREYSDLIGPQILEIQGVSIEQDPNNSAGVKAIVDLDLPDVYLDGSFTFNLF